MSRASTLRDGSRRAQEVETPLGVSPVDVAFEGRRSSHALNAWNVQCEKPRPGETERDIEFGRWTRDVAQVSEVRDIDEGQLRPEAPSLSWRHGRPRQAP
jgi:hypothetical protein